MLFAGRRCRSHFSLSLLPNTKPTENLIEQIVGINRADDFAQLMQRSAQMGGDQFITLRRCGRDECFASRGLHTFKTISTAPCSARRSWLRVVAGPRRSLVLIQPARFLARRSREASSRQAAKRAVGRTWLPGSCASYRAARRPEFHSVPTFRAAATNRHRATTFRPRGCLIQFVLGLARR